VKFSSLEFKVKVTGESTVIFGDTQISLKHSLSQIEGSQRAKKPARFTQPFRYNTSV